MAWYTCRQWSCSWLDREGVAIEAMKRGAQDYLVKDNLTPSKRLGGR